jgi:hypothetical protein
VVKLRCRFICIACRCKRCLGHQARPKKKGVHLHALLAGNRFREVVGEARLALTHETTLKLVLDLTVSHCDPLVLTQVLKPGLDQEALDEACGIRYITEQPPVERSIASPHLSVTGHDGQELLELLGIDVVFKLHHNRSPIRLRFGSDQRSRPVHRGYEVHAFMTADAIRPGEHTTEQCAQGASYERLRYAEQARDLAPEHTPPGQAPHEDHHEER